jgi:MFS family permease
MAMPQQCDDGRPKEEGCTVARASMYTMLGLTSTVHFLTREMGPQLIPFICSEFNFSAQQRGLLLGAYFPGYVCGQLPAAMLADRIGGKRVMSLSMWGTVAMMLLTAPTSSSISAAFAVSAMLGFCGGPLYPVHGILKRDWMPMSLGAERAVVLRVTNWGMQTGRFLTSFLTPLLATRWGWRAAPLLYAALTGLVTIPWEAWASSTPKRWNGWPQMNAIERQLLTAEMRPQCSVLKTRAFPWRLLMSVPAVAPIVMHTADNMGTYCFAYWAPTYFQQVLGVSPTMTGAYLASSHLFSVFGGVVAPAIEVGLLRSGWTPLSVRRVVGSAGSFLQAGSLALFGLVRSPVLGAALVSANNFFKCLTNDGGYQTNYIEVGGPDTGVLYATGQTVANIPGMFVTVGGAALLKTFGSWLPLFFGVSSLQVIAGLIFATMAQVSPQHLREADKSPM